MKRTFFLYVVLIGMGVFNHGYAYEPSTHEILSTQATLQSNIYKDGSLFSDIGLPDSGQPVYTGIGDGVPSASQLDAKSVVAFGTRAEDFYEPWCNGVGWSVFADVGRMRVFNHFFDPQHNGVGLDMGLPYWTIGVPSPDWALEDKNEVTTVRGPCADAGRQQDYSYSAGQAHYLKMLTASTATERLQESSAMLQTLGHVIHHIQDMAQPQHSRNDRHSEKDQAWYESYTETKVNSRLKTGGQNLVITGLDLVDREYIYPIPSFGTARQYWHTAGSTTSYLGMAEFTSKNYVTFGTNFRSAFDASGKEKILPNVDYPLPSGTNVDGTEKYLAPIYRRLTLMDGSKIDSYMSYVVGSVYDGYAYGSQPGKLLAATSLFDVPLKKANRSRLFLMNSIVFEDNYPILLPRAVAFSAGLINHFFTGRLNLTHLPSGGWTISNGSSESMAGTFTLYYEDTAGKRTVVPPFQNDVGAWGGTLAPGSTTPRLAEPPTSTVKLIAVFLGKIGTETALNRVAGKIINYSVTPCTLAHKLVGGNSSREWVVDFGSLAGRFRFQLRSLGRTHFELRYDNPQRSQISSIDLTGGWCPNPLLRGAPNSCAGVPYFSGDNLDFNPATYGSTKIRVLATPIDAGASWSVGMTCPNDNSVLEDPGFPPTTVRFGFGQALQGAAGFCTADTYVDGQFVGNAYVSAQGGTERSVNMTSGIPHFVEYINYSCTSDNRNILVGTAYTDATGTHKLQDMSSTAVRSIVVY